MKELTQKDEDQELEEEALMAVGVDTLKLQPELSKVINNWLTKDHAKELEDNFMKKYPRTVEGCNVEAPKLNQEVISSSPEATTIRDKHFVTNQNIAGSASVAMSSAINTLLTKNKDVDKYDLIGRMSDSLKMVAQLHYKFAQARRAYITPTVSKECRSTLEESVPDTFLYRDKLSEKIRSSKAITKVGEDLKTRTTNVKPVTRSLN